MTILSKIAGRAYYAVEARIKPVRAGAGRSGPQILNFLFFTVEFLKELHWLEILKKK